MCDRQIDADVEALLVIGQPPWVLRRADLHQNGPKSAAKPPKNRRQSKSHRLQPALVLLVALVLVAGLRRQAEVAARRLERGHAQLLSNAVVRDVEEARLGARRADLRSDRRHAGLGAVREPLQVDHGDRLRLLLRVAGHVVPGAGARG